MSKIIIVEDDQKIAKELSDTLKENAHQPIILTNFDNTAENILSKDADLVLLDINIPGLNGQQILKRIRTTSQIPVIILTSRSSETDEVVSMSYGADDFVRKPYNPQVLLLRIDAVINRAKGQAREILRHKDLEINIAKSTIKSPTAEIALSKNELAILIFLVKNQDKIISRIELMDYLWNDDQFVDDNTLTVNINRLRQKLAEVGLDGIIQTRRGQGYILS